MSSNFDSDVNKKRNQNPWASINVFAFGREMASNGRDADSQIAENTGLNPKKYHSGKNDFVLVIQDRPDVRSGYWFIVKWTGADGCRHYAEAQDLGLCMWRAAQRELEVTKKMEEK